MNATYEAKQKAKAKEREHKRLIVARRWIDRALRQLDAEYRDRRAITNHEVHEMDRDMRATRAKIARWADDLDKTIASIDIALAK